MNGSFKFLFIGALLLGLCCSKDRVENTIPSIAQTKELTKITSTNSDNSFVDADGKLFFPWGFNYTNPQIIGLIEDNWDQESTWQVIEEDFLEMKTYSANIVRIHLQYNKFMIDASTPDPEALERLQRLVKIAEDTRLYLDITGLAAYRKSDSPSWYDSLNDNERWATHAIFWKSIAAAVGDSEAVFAFNLINEPVVSVGCDEINQCEWLPGNGFGGFYFVQNIARNPDLNFSTGIKDWTAMLTNAIRLEDKNTMITIGFLSLGSISQFEGDLDYLSMHIYPKSGEIQQSVDKVLSSQSMVPLILEETSSLNCSVQELETFLSDIDGKYNGLMGHYFGKTLEEMEASGNIVDALHKNFVDFFIANNPN